MTQPAEWNLYHRIADADSAEVRRRLGSSSWVAESKVRFRNVDTGAEALAELKQLSGSDEVPVLENVASHQIYKGKAAIVRVLGL